MTVRLPLFIQEPLFWNVQLTNQISNDLGKNPIDNTLNGTFLLFGTGGSNGCLIETIGYKSIGNTMIGNKDLHFFYQSPGSTTKRLILSHKLIGDILPSETYLNPLNSPQKELVYIDLPPILTPINSYGLRLPSNSSLFVSASEEVNISLTAIGGYY